jgi:hypothetical protein
MIGVARAPEPSAFDERVRKPGLRWLTKGTNGPAPSYWRRAARDLRRAFHERCGYTAMWLSTPGTVDHFISADEDPSLLFEWTNFRYAAAWVNSRKGALRADQVLDPFEVGEGWFEIQLPSCELVMTERCPPEYRARPETMLARLGLARSEDVIAYRLEWYRMYAEGEITLEGLERKAPLIARAIREQRTDAAGCAGADDGAARGPTSK